MTAGEHLKQRMIMVKFLLVDRPSTYNTIIARSALNKLEAITSTAHLKMKFSPKKGVREVKHDQWVARQCYNTSLKDLPEKTSLGVKTKEEDK